MKDIDRSRILVTGAGGFVGSNILKNMHCMASVSMQRSTEEEIKRIVDESGADVIIHTAAISDIGACDKNPGEAYHANVEIPVMLARACAGKKLICFSSDQVYSGNSFEGPYTEDDVLPGNLYAEYKLEMENRVLDILPETVMLRAEWMYDFYPPRGNYFMNVIRACGLVKGEEASGILSFSSSQYRGITYVKEVVENMPRVAMLPGGSYNFGSEADKSMWEITEEFVEYLGVKAEVKNTGNGHNLWMNCTKAQKHGIEFLNINQALRMCTENNRDKLRL